jgi:hypothetical protein
VRWPSLLSSIKSLVNEYVSQYVSWELTGLPERIAEGETVSVTAVLTNSGFLRLSKVEVNLCAVQQVLEQTGEPHQIAVAYVGPSGSEPQHGAWNPDVFDLPADSTREFTFNIKGVEDTDGERREIIGLVLSGFRVAVGDVSLSQAQADFGVGVGIRMHDLEVTRTIGK